MSRSSALVLTPRLPWPLDDGGRIVLWQSLVSTARFHDVTLVCFVPPGAEGGPLPDAVASACRRVVRVPFRPLSTWRAASRGLVGRWPYTLARYQDSAFARAVA